MTATPIVCRGIRGAITADTNDRDEILKQTRRLLAMLIRQNGIDPADVAFAVFSTTPDLNAEFPALAARQFGWLDVPLLCTSEIAVRDALPRCIRILISWNTTKGQSEIHHIYLREAVSLRPDMTSLPPVDWNELEQWIADNTTPPPA